jgi:Mrp family chromosome partitioning ATPase
MTEAKNTCTNSGCEESCCEGCESKPQSFIEASGEFTNVKKVIAVVSGKGGVGKSLVTGMLAVTMNRLGYKPRFLTRISPVPRFRVCSGSSKKRKRVSWACTL